MVYPAHLASLEGSSPFMYQLRYVKESECNANKTLCVPFFNELNPELLGHIKLLGESALNELKNSSNWSGIESYLLTGATFRHFLQDIYVELKNVTVIELVKDSRELPENISAKSKIIKKLEALNRFDLGLNEELVNAIFSLAQLTEVDEILTEMNVSAEPLY